jgi:hypothetical protein
MITKDEYCRLSSAMIVCFASKGMWIKFVIGIQDTLSHDPSKSFTTLCWAQHTPRSKMASFATFSIITIRGLEDVCALLSANDYRMHEVRAFKSGCFVRLGEALTDNTMVFSLALNTRMQDGSNTTTTTTTRGAASRYRRPEALLAFIAHSQTLQEFTLKEFDDQDGPANDKALCADILAALAQSTCVAKFDCGVRVPSKSLSHLLCRTTSLLNLEIDLDQFTNEPDRLLIAQGLGSNNTLCRLLLLGLTDNFFTEAILSHRPAHSTLKELVIVPRAQNVSVDAISTYLRSSNINHFVWKAQHFEKEKWELLSDALRSNPAIEKLTLEYCTFDTQGTLALIKSMRPASDGCVVVKELSLTRFPDVTMLGNSLTTFGDAAFGIVVADLLADSSLERLSVTGLCSGGEMKEEHCFFRILDENNANIRVSSLHVDYLTDTEAEAFTFLMRQSTHLQSFTVDGAIDLDFNQYNIVNALRENGSLRTMALAEDQMYPASDGPPLSKRDRREMKMYLKRNAILTQLLRRPRLDDTHDDAIDVTDLALFPVLFSAANVATCMAPTWFLTGLLAASGTSIGPTVIRDA